MVKLRGVGVFTVILGAAAAVATQACEDDGAGGPDIGFEASTGTFEAGGVDGSVPDAPPALDAAPDVVIEAALNDGSAPVQILTEFENPRAIAADGAFLYIATRRGVFRLAKDGSSTIRMTLDESASSLTRDGARIFFTTPIEVKMIPTNAVDGGSEVSLVTNDAGLLPLRVSAGNVYYGVYRSSFGDEIHAIDEDGGNERVVASQVFPYDFAAVGTTLFAASKGGSPTGILQLPDDGGARISRATPFGQVSDFLARDGYVYWTTRGGTVMRIPVAGGPEETIATGEGPVAGIAVDDTNAYWVRYEQSNPVGVVRRAPRGGGAAPITLASGQLSAFSIAVDDTHVYWTALRSDGGVRRVPK